MKKRKLEQLVAELGPAILVGGYARTILLGCPVTITYSGGSWRAEFAFTPDVVKHWEEEKLLALLIKGVTWEACPFDQTTFADWQVGSPQQERRFQEFRHQMEGTPVKTAPRKKKKPVTSRTLTIVIDPASYEPALCQQCDAELSLEESRKGSMFCGDRCAQVAATIRSARVSTRNGKYHEIDSQGNPSMTRMATDLRIAFVSFGNGYPTKARKLTEQQRIAIFERDDYTCQYIDPETGVMCGRIATDIDHISGSSPDPSNLRALCKGCNVGRAIKRLPTLTPEQEAIKASIWASINARYPQRPCHDEQRWKHIWGDVKRIHREGPTQAERLRRIADL